MSSKQQWTLVAFVIALAVYLSSSRDDGAGAETEPVRKADRRKNQNRTPSSQRARVLPQPTETVTPKLAKVPKAISTFLPDRMPASLRTRFEQKIVFEDDAYFGSELNFDGRPIEGADFRWMKGANPESLERTAGELPQIQKVVGSFPTPDQSARIAEDAVGREGDILSMTEVWYISSSQALSPQLRVEVRTNGRAGFHSGHEIWFVGVNSGKILKRVEADRY